MEDTSRIPNLVILGLDPRIQTQAQLRLTSQQPKEQCAAPSSGASRHLLPDGEKRNRAETPEFR